ncbi:hypothetical protein SAMN04487911_11117 [Arenibacter nanhaiticus]|uniref:Uncharacterized protein n=1 Tax=Arenibacter nanhaiticus TaxID=558155 RepID=A0A1M6GHN8_9FLAO|nr:hypothetical protein SAMN04487911_11117 [Arenibacter nanhaiticus]
MNVPLIVKLFLDFLQRLSKPGTSVIEDSTIDSLSFLHKGEI